MAIFTVTTSSGGKQSIDSQSVSRVIDNGTSRTVWIGPADVAAKKNTQVTEETKSVIVKDTLAAIEKASGLMSIKNVTTGKKTLIGGGHVSRVLDDGTRRLVWFGPGEIHGVMSTSIKTDASLSNIYTKLGLVKLTPSESYLKNVAAGPKYVSSVGTSGTGAVIYFGNKLTARGVYASTLSVKESVSTLKSKGIGR